MTSPPTTLTTVREARRDDIPQVLALYGHTGMGSQTGFSVANGERWLDQLARYPDYRLYVALNGPHVVGTYALLIMDNISHGGQPSGVVESVAVHPDWQRRGVGREMMAHAMARCRSKGCYKITLSSNLRRHEAHAFYDSLGFERHGYSFRISLD